MSSKEDNTLHQSVNTVSMYHGDQEHFGLQIKIKVRTAVAEKQYMKR